MADAGSASGLWDDDYLKFIVRLRSVAKNKLNAGSHIKYRRGILRLSKDKVTFSMQIKGDNERKILTIPLENIKIVDETNPVLIEDHKNVLQIGYDLCDDQKSSNSKRYFSYFEAATGQDMWRAIGIIRNYCQNYNDYIVLETMYHPGVWDDKSTGTAHFRCCKAFNIRCGGCKKSSMNRIDNMRENEKGETPRGQRSGKPLPKPPAKPRAPRPQSEQQSTCEKDQCETCSLDLKASEEGQYYTSPVDENVHACRSITFHSNGDAVRLKNCKKEPPPVPPPKLPPKPLSRTSPSKLQPLRPPPPSKHVNTVNKLPVVPLASATAHHKLQTSVKEPINLVIPDECGEPRPYDYENGSNDRSEERGVVCDKNQTEMTPDYQDVSSNETVFSRALNVLPKKIIVELPVAKENKKEQEQASNCSETSSSFRCSSLIAYNLTEICEKPSIKAPCPQPEQLSTCGEDQHVIPLDLKATEEGQYCTSTDKNKYTSGPITSHSNGDGEAEGNVAVVYTNPVGAHGSAGTDIGESCENAGPVRNKNDAVPEVQKSKCETVIKPSHQSYEKYREKGSHRVLTGGGPNAIKLGADQPTSEDSRRAKPVLAEDKQDSYDEADDLADRYFTLRKTSNQPIALKRGFNVEKELDDISIDPDYTTIDELSYQSTVKGGCEVIRAFDVEEELDDISIDPSYTTIEELSYQSAVKGGMNHEVDGSDSVHGAKQCKSSEKGERMRFKDVACQTLDSTQTSRYNIFK